VNNFRKAYEEDAEKLGRDTPVPNRGQGFEVQAIQESANRLFNPKMYELLYARDVFKDSTKTEGAFSNARAVT